MSLSDAPPIIQQIAGGAWPETLRGLELDQVLALIDSGNMESVNWFDVTWEIAEENGETLGPDHGYVAHLKEVEIADLEMPELGVADPAVVAEYAQLSSPPPPVVIWDKALRDGYHRIGAALLRKETCALAYVVTRESHAS